MCITPFVLEHPYVRLCTIIAYAELRTIITNVVQFFQSIAHTT